MLFPCRLEHPLLLQEVLHLYQLVQGDINPPQIVAKTLADLPAIGRQLMLSWSDRVLQS